MRDAAVGFQCPSCISEGARSTRSGRTAYGGQRSANPALTSMVLIGINAAVWLAIVATGWRTSPLVDRLALIARGRCTEGEGYYPTATDADLCATVPTATWFPGVADGAWWQLVTNTFTHVDVWHIGFNMLALWFLGPQLELAIGRARFLTVYLGSALAGSAFVYWLTPVATYTLGASGAIFGLMAGLLIVALKVRGDVQQLLVWIGINAAITVMGRGLISWQGHLGGFVGGLLLMAVIVYAPRMHRGRWQLAGFTAYAVLLAAALVVRTLVLA